MTSSGPSDRRHDDEPPHTRPLRQPSAGQWSDQPPPRRTSRPDGGQPGKLAGHSDRDVHRGGHGAKVAAASKKVASVGGTAGRGAVRLARRASHAQGAGETGLFRLIELHAIHAAGDAALAVSLAGTLFFSSPTDAARGQIALFLVITMLPFSVLAPLIGPFLDRHSRGRRWAIGATMALRAFGCWTLASAVVTNSAWLFPAALLCLVSSKAYGVTRAAAVPRLLPSELTLVKANSRISLSGIAGAAVSGPLAAGFSQIGPEWSLRYAAALFVFATILAILLPPAVDSSEGEERFDGKRRVRLSPMVVTALRCNAGLRALSGFLLMFMAFLIREHPLPGWEGPTKTTLLLGLVVGSVGVGSSLGTVVGSLVKDRKPESVVVGVLVADAVAAVVAALFYDLVPAMLLGLTAGLSQQLGKLSLDALIQREVPEKVRTSVFGRSETLLQLSWVLGGFVGVVMPSRPKLGLCVAAVALIVWLVVVLRHLGGMRARARSETSGGATAYAAGPPGDPASADATPTQQVRRRDPADDQPTTRVRAGDASGDRSSSRARPRDPADDQRTELMRRPRRKGQNPGPRREL